MLDSDDGDEYPRKLTPEEIQDLRQDMEEAAKYFSEVLGIDLLNPPEIPQEKFEAAMKELKERSAKNRKE